MESGGEGFAGDFAVGVGDGEVDEEVGFAGEFFKGFVEVVAGDGSIEFVFFDFFLGGVFAEVNDGDDLEVFGFEGGEPSTGDAAGTDDDDTFMGHEETPVVRKRGHCKGKRNGVKQRLRKMVTKDTKDT